MSDCHCGNTDHVRNHWTLIVNDMTSLVSCRKMFIEPDENDLNSSELLQT